jgi:hypothetical protein
MPHSCRKHCRNGVHGLLFEPHEVSFKIHASRESQWLRARIVLAAINNKQHAVLHGVIQLPPLQEFGRRPQRFVLKWRMQGQGYHNHNSRASASCNMPPVVQAPYQGTVQVCDLCTGQLLHLEPKIQGPHQLWRVPPHLRAIDFAWCQHIRCRSMDSNSGCAVQAEAIEKAAITLLSRNVTSPFNLTLLNLGAHMLDSCDVT